MTVCDSWPGSLYTGIRPTSTVPMETLQRHGNAEGGCGCYTHVFAFVVAAAVGGVLAVFVAVIVVCGGGGVIAALVVVAVCC